MVDRVNKPSHYTARGYEPIDVIESWNLNFALGNAIKYIGRHGLKAENGLNDKEKTIEDLKKAAWYINREIERLSK